MLPPLAATRSAHVEHELIVLAVSLMKFNDISEFGQKMIHQVLPPLAATRSAHVQHELIILAVSLMKFNDIFGF